MMDIRKFFAKVDGKHKKEKPKAQPETPSTVASDDDKERENSSLNTNNSFAVKKSSLKSKSPARKGTKKAPATKKARTASINENGAAPNLKTTTKRMPPKYPVGTEVEKFFPDHGTFRGTVTAVQQDGDEFIYSVKYTDGDKEDCNEDELECILVANKRSQKRRIRAQNTDQDEESEQEEAGFDGSDSDEEMVFASRRHGKMDARAQRALLEESSDEEMAQDCKPAAKSSAGTTNRRPLAETKPAAKDNGKHDASSQDKPPPAKKPKTFDTSIQDKSGDKPPPAKKQKASVVGAWGSLVMCRGQVSKKKTSKSTAGGSNRVVRAAYSNGDDLPIITEPAKMFDDMISVQLTDNGANAATLLPLLKKLNGRPLKVATMCSGTESPILALDMLSKSIEDFYHSHKDKFDGIDVKDGELLIQIEHVFSCEIEPFKQSYIERNFHPPLLFRDIRELGKDKAFTAYGAEVDVPCQPGCVDLLVAGTSCVDYSNLNNEKLSPRLDYAMKTISGSGESGQTWRGLIQWIEKAQPPIVVLENVCGAPWQKKVEIFEGIGYHAAWIKVDTKDYYIPHTRQRGYLFAVRKKPADSDANPVSKQLVKKWHDTVKKLERPASGTLEAFMLPNDDPRVLRGRARLSGADSADQTTNDWVKCQSRHQFARASEELGEKHPLTGSDSGNTTMPPFAWNEWTNAQVQRIHDLLDITMLRCSKEDIDMTTKCMVLDLSQNVDRSITGKLGLSQCLTPSGVPYVTNRGGPLVGEEVLLLQGIPADDLILTKETEKNLKDLAGNAMSTTVVGACMLSALLFGHAAMATSIHGDEAKSSKGMMVPSLVPRPMALASSGIIITRKLSKYSESLLQLGPLHEPSIAAFNELLREAASSARMCVTEGVDSALPFSSLLKCQQCGFTCSKDCATPLPSKFEEHELGNMDQPDDARVNPSMFRRKMLSALPMRIQLRSFNVDSLQKPSDVSDSLWEGWKIAVMTSTQSSNSSSTSEEYRFSSLKRSHLWTATFASSNGSRLELQVSKAGAVWFLFAKPPDKKGDLREALKKPIARMLVPADGGCLYANGQWQICLPTKSMVELTIEGIGETKPSWRSLLGLKGEYETEVRFEKLRVSVEAEGWNDLKSKIDGEYLCLPKCGGACGSMHKRQTNGSGRLVGGDEAMYFFLDSGSCTMGDEDSFVFSVDKHRTSYGEFRDILLKLDPAVKYRPEFNFSNTDDRKSQRLRAIIPGSWSVINGAVLQPILVAPESSHSTLTVPVEPPHLALSPDGWKACPAILETQVEVAANDWLFEECKRLLSRSDESSVIEVNLQKSASIFQFLAFATSRLLVPAVARDWLTIDSDTIDRSEDGEEIACQVCAPARPGVKWTIVEKGKSRQALPMEDGKLQARFEYAMKHRPQAWLFTLEIPQRDNTSMPSQASLLVRIGVNAVSLAHRALRLFPDTLARRAMLDVAGAKRSGPSEANTAFEWRVLSHVDKSSVLGSATSTFPKLTFTSNKKTSPASQPPGFVGRHPLRPEQLRSLAWMLSQEATSIPYMEEEVVEALLPGLDWRAEVRAKRPVLVRGGIVADEVGYGKTAITLGLIDAAPTVNGDAPKMPAKYAESFFHTNATLVVVPTHLMGQWPKECSKFLGSTKNVVVIKDMNTFNKLTVGDILNADIVIVNFSVLCNEKYFHRLARFAGVDTGSLPKGSKGGRHFDAVYKECLVGVGNRIAAHREDPTAAFDEIERDAKRHESLAQEGLLRLDGKKSVYKSLSEEQAKAKGSASAKAKSSPKTKVSAADVDPWDLKTSKVKKDIKNMKCPPLEIFFWNRLVVDEFTYLLEKTDRACVQSVVQGLKSSFRWGLSATPAHENFNEIKGLSSLSGIHLGIDEALPAILSKKKRGGKSKDDQEKSASEKFSSLLEVRSMQWHERRHRIGQEFLDRFVRQNIAEIDEIKCEEHMVLMDIPAAERGIYLEMANYLKSLEYDNKKALRSKKSSKGDRENRMQRILEGSNTAEEALLKRCAHFNMSSEPSTALETCDLIIVHRKEELDDCENELVVMIAAAIRQRNLILKEDKGWKGTTKTEKGEVADTLERYISDVHKKNSIQGGADEEIHQRLLDILNKAEDEVSRNPLKEDATFAMVNGGTLEDDDEEEDGKKGSKRKRKEKEDERADAERLYAMKYAIRDHMHHVRSVAKELRGRMQALRYFQWVRNFQLEETKHHCIGNASPFCDCSSDGIVPRDRLGVLTSCGHVGCLSCLKHHADREDCIEPTCEIPIKSTHIASAVGLGADREHAAGGQYGAKLRAIVEKAKEIVENGDRAVVFVQFDDLKKKVEDALLASCVKSLKVEGTLQQKVKALDILQKETPSKDDPRVLLLTMDDESSAGVNLTTCSHAIFVHPLLADSQQQYDAYETQAIGRIRRYGQTKTVHIWRYLARDSIDTEIYEERRGSLPEL